MISVSTPPISLGWTKNTGVPCAPIRGWLRPEVLEAVELLKPLAKQAGATLAQFSLAWILREPNVASTIVGASRPEQLDDNAAAAELTVDPALFAKAEAIVAGLPARAP